MIRLVWFDGMIRHAVQAWLGRGCTQLENSGFSSSCRRSFPFFLCPCCAAAFLSLFHLSGESWHNKCLWCGHIFGRYHTKGLTFEVVVHPCGWGSQNTNPCCGQIFDEYHTIVSEHQMGLRGLSTCHGLSLLGGCSMLFGQVGSMVVSIQVRAIGVLCPVVASSRFRSTGAPFPVLCRWVLLCGLCL